MCHMAALCMFSNAFVQFVRSSCFVTSARDNTISVSENTNIECQMILKMTDFWFVIIAAKTGGNRFSTKSVHVRNIYLRSNEKGQKLDLAYRLQRQNQNLHNFIFLGGPIFQTHWHSLSKHQVLSSYTSGTTLATNATPGTIEHKGNYLISWPVSFEKKKTI